MSMNLVPVALWDLSNALCHALPFIADADPVFAKLVLEPETWRNLVLVDGKRFKWDGELFGGVLNNALLHVLGSLANNHFTVIEDLLDHRYLVARYTYLMPHYVFGVLFEKVAILGQLAQERHDLWALPDTPSSPKMDVN